MLRNNTMVIWRFEKLYFWKNHKKVFKQHNYVSWIKLKLVMWKNYIRWLRTGVIMRMDYTRITEGQLRKSDKMKSKRTL